MSKLDDMAELGAAWCNEVQFAKLIAVARAAQNMMEWENIKREDTLRGLELTSIVDPYCSDIHSTCEALDKALVSLEEEEDEVKVLEKALVALEEMEIDLLSKWDICWSDEGKKNEQTR